MNTALAVGTLFALVYGGLAVLAARRPLLLRLAAREAIRRRGQSLLVVGGLMVGTAGITASLTAADWTRDAAAVNARRTWGMVDLTVDAGGAFFDSRAANRLAHDRRLQPLVDGIQAGVEQVGAVANLDRRLGEPSVRIIGFDPATQAAFGAFTLLDGRTTLGGDLREGEVLVSRPLAEALGVQIGDRLAVTVEVAGATRAKTPPARRPLLRVAGVARSTGPGAYGLRPAVFVPLVTAHKVTGTDRINVVRVSARGGLASGVEGGRAAAPVLRRVVDELREPTALAVRQVKASEVQQTMQRTELTRAMLFGMSGLIVAAGSALVIHLLLILAEERRPRLGILRALGLRRRGLLWLSLLEGGLYSLAASTVGTIVGLGAGRIVAERFAQAFAEFTGGALDVVLDFRIHPQTVAAAFALGALVTLATVFLAARRTSRMSIPAAIRDLPDPTQQRLRRRPRTALAVTLAGGGVAALTQTDKTLVLLGGAALVVAASVLTRAWITGRFHASLTGLALAGWALGVTATLTEADTSDPNRFFSVFSLAVLVSVLGLSITVSANLTALERTAVLLGAGSRRLLVVLRPPLAYLARRPLRTGLTSGMFAVVLAIITLLAVFLSLFGPRYGRDSLGYDLRVTATGRTSLPLPRSVSPNIQRKLSIPTREYVGPLRSPFMQSETAFVPLHALSRRDLLDQPPTRLTAFDQRFHDPGQVWEALRDDPTWVVSDVAYPGDRIVLQTPGGPVTFRIAANQQFGILRGVIASDRALAPFRAAPLGVTMLVDTVPAADPDAVARRIERALFSQGVNAETTRKLLDDGYRANRTFFSVVEVLMRMGLVIGLLSLGIVGLRAVVERRRVIGVLRALGYRRRSVLVGLVAEATLTATLGALIGFATGAVMGYLFAREFVEDTPYGIDRSSIGTALGLLYVAVALVSLGPAWQASRQPPAEAVRYVE